MKFSLSFSVPSFEIEAPSILEAKKKAKNKLKKMKILPYSAHLHWTEEIEEKNEKLVA